MATYTMVRGGLRAQRLLSKSSPFRANPMLGYGFGLLAFGIALVSRLWIGTALPPGFPFLTFFPAVIISAFIAGTRPGLLCASLSFVAVWYWFLGDGNSFALSYGAAVALGFYVLIVAVDIALISSAANSIDRLSAQQAQLNAIVETVPLGMIMADYPTGRIVGTNGRIEEMFGSALAHSGNIITFRELFDFVDDARPGIENENHLTNLISYHQRHPNVEVQYQREDAPPKWFRILVRPVRERGKIITGIVIAVIDIDQEHQNRVALEDAINAKDLLLYEVNHRVKNSLHLVNSFLFLEAMKLDENAAQSAIMAARSKVEMIARVHQLLYESGAHNNVDMKIVIEEMIRDLVSAAGREDVALNFIFSNDLMIGIKQASPLVLLVNEIVTNSLKHGLNSQFPKLDITASRIDNDILVAISDNGAGMPCAKGEKAAGLGSKIIEGLAHQMRGEITIQNADPGTKVALRAPLDI